ncbi:MAG: ATP-dependent 6-phosphofructokinase [Deltaproteobacteria bacterium]|jgi:6-phosphofructokinase 1|nr:ATP-dependent 6-phosphofructokinase [Deltaproteobacteria bacterium]
MNFLIDTVGQPKIISPLAYSNNNNDFIPNFIPDDNKIRFDTIISKDKIENSQSFEMAGPRKVIYFDPLKTKAAIVTCGGLSPGINTVINALVTELVEGYGVNSVIGFQYGFAGLVPEGGYSIVELSPELTSEWSLEAGSSLGSSRGAQDVEAMVDSLERLNINMLFAIGGDGTQRGAMEIYREVEKRNYRISIVGVPKTIDNDISYISKTFGYETAAAKASQAIEAARVEAEGAPRGVGLVKLMGRHSGAITAYASLANGNVDAVLIPESPFKLEGENGLFAWIEKQLESKDSALVVAAEGAGQELFDADNEKYDASGNKKLQNIGLLLKERITSYFQEAGVPVNLKYIDPSYIIRSTPPSPGDAVFCNRLGQNAVHAAMAGKTGLIIGLWKEDFTHIPLEAAVSRRKTVDTDGSFWGSVLQMSGQPPRFI